MKEAMKISIEHKISARFARVIWKTGARLHNANICDVLDGKTKANAAVKRFAASWMAPNL